MAPGTGATEKLTPDALKQTCVGPDTEATAAGAEEHAQPVGCQPFGKYVSTHSLVEL